MLAAERRVKLADLVQAAGALSTEDLAEALDVSAETIRRDLLALDKRGMLARVHGGATKLNQSAVSFEPSFDVRSGVSLERKQRIATAAAALAPSGSLLMIDIGTTAQLVARALPVSLSATVVTTSLRVALELIDRPQIEVVIAGGRLRSGDLAVSGPAAARMIDGMHFDMAFLGSGGLDAKSGLTDYYLEEAETRRAVIGSSTTSYVLCDATKFGTVARYRAGQFGEFTGLVVDEAPDGELLDRVQESGTELVIAD